MYLNQCLEHNIRIIQDKEQEQHKSFKSQKNRRSNDCFALQITLLNVIQSNGFIHSIEMIKLKIMYQLRFEFRD